MTKLSGKNVSIKNPYYLRLLPYAKLKSYYEGIYLETFAY